MRNWKFILLSICFMGLVACGDDEKSSKKKQTTDSSAVVNDNTAAGVGITNNNSGIQNGNINTQPILTPGRHSCSY